MKVILPGSYDPVTLGHLDIIKRASREFDEVFAVIFANPKKKYKFSLEDRVRMLILGTDGLDNVIVSYSNGLVIDYMREHGIDRIVKGYRTDADLPWEREQAEWNKIHGGYDTELWKCRDAYENISSTLARDAIDNGRELTEILPREVIEYIESRRDS